HHEQAVGQRALRDRGQLHRPRLARRGRRLHLRARGSTGRGHRRHEDDRTKARAHHRPPFGAPSAFGSGTRSITVRFDDTRYFFATAWAWAGVTDSNGCSAVLISAGSPRKSAKAASRFALPKLDSSWS